jgi:hypothetical protein
MEALWLCASLSVNLWRIHDYVRNHGLAVRLPLPQHDTVSCPCCGILMRDGSIVRLLDSLPNHTDTTLTRFQRGDLPSWRAYLAYQLVYGSLLSWEEIEDMTFILKNSAKDLAYVKELAHFRLAHTEYFVHGRVVRPPTVLSPVPTMSMFGNYDLRVYTPCRSWWPIPLRRRTAREWCSQQTMMRTGWWIT